MLIISDIATSNQGGRGLSQFRTMELCKATKHSEYGEATRTKQAIYNKLNKLKHMNN